MSNPLQLAQLYLPQIRRGGVKRVSAALYKLRSGTKDKRRSFAGELAGGGARASGRAARSRLHASVR